MEKTDRQHNYYHRERLLWCLEEKPFDDAARSAFLWLTGRTFDTREEAIKWIKIHL